MKKHQSFRHITDSDRDRIQALRDSWHTQKEVATILGFSESALSRELNRDPTRVGRYVADRAREHAEEKRTHSKYPGIKVEARPDLKQYIIRELKKLRSPDEIAGRLKKEGAMPRSARTRYTNGFTARRESHIAGTSARRGVAYDASVISRNEYSFRTENPLKTGLICPAWCMLSAICLSLRRGCTQNPQAFCLSLPQHSSSEDPYFRTVKAQPSYLRHNGM